MQRPLPGRRNSQRCVELRGEARDDAANCVQWIGLERTVRRRTGKSAERGSRSKRTVLDAALPSAPRRVRRQQRRRARARILRATSFGNESRSTEVSAPVSTSRAGDRCPGPRIVAPILPRRWRRGVIIRDAAEKFRRFVRPLAIMTSADVQRLERGFASTTRANAKQQRPAMRDGVEHRPVRRRNFEGRKRRSECAW
jgi:hypothetical protein